MRLFLVAVGASHLPAVAGAATLVVPDQFSSIQVAIASAVEGDTVLVRPGTYHETLAWANKNLTLLGDGLGPPVIITADATSRVLIVGAGVTQQTVIENLTIRDGRAEAGAGITLFASSPVIRHCRFEGNVAEVHPSGDGPSRGGALFVSSGSNPLVRDCSFFQNQSLGSVPFIEWWGEGGAVHVESGGSLDVRRCHFQENEVWGVPEGGNGGGLSVALFASGAVVDSCTFDYNYYAVNGGGVFAQAPIVVRNSIFQDNHGWSGSALWVFGTFSIENNQFIGNVVGGSEGGAITAIGTGPIRNNTIAFNEGENGRAGLWAIDATAMNNIIGGNNGWGIVQCPNDPQAFACNDVWGNTINGAPANYNGCDLTGQNGNISADPLFCDATSGDYRLLPASPCAPENSPPGCGLIGALPAGCGVNGVLSDAAPSTALRLTVMPNPVRGVARFELGPGAPLLMLNIFDSQGRLIEQLSRRDGRWEWAPDSRVPAGVYFARPEVGKASSAAIKFLYLR